LDRGVHIFLLKRLERAFLPRLTYDEVSGFETGRRGSKTSKWLRVLGIAGVKKFLKSCERKMAGRGYARNRALKPSCSKCLSFVSRFLRPDDAQAAALQSKAGAACLLVEEFGQAFDVHEADAEAFQFSHGHFGEAFFRLGGGSAEAVGDQLAEYV
jgi:hypothetical protein